MQATIRANTNTAKNGNGFVIIQMYKIYFKNKLLMNEFLIKIHALLLPPTNKHIIKKNKETHIYTIRQ